MINTKVDLALIMGLVKKTHSPEYVYINKNIILTMNEFESVLSKIEYNENISNIPMFFNMADMKLLLEAYKDSLKENDSVLVNINNFPEPSMNVYYRMMHKYNKLLTEYNYQDTINDLHTHQTILNIITSNASSGRFNLIVNGSKDRYLMIIYKGLLPLTKADTINLSIYKPIVENKIIYNEYYQNYDIEEDHFMTRFDIFKKKEKILIQQYMLFKIPKTYVSLKR